MGVGGYEGGKGSWSPKPPFCILDLTSEKAPVSEG